MLDYDTPFRQAITVAIQQSLLSRATIFKKRTVWTLLISLISYNNMVLLFNFLIKNWQSNVHFIVSETEMDSLNGAVSLLFFRRVRSEWKQHERLRDPSDFSTSEYTCVSTVNKRKQKKHRTLQETKKVVDKANFFNQIYQCDISAVYWRIWTKF